MSFIRVLMIVTQYIEPSGSDSVYDDFSEKPSRLSPNCEVLGIPGIPLTQPRLPVDIDNFTDYCPFSSTDPRAPCLGELGDPAVGRLEIPITES